jgi:hypothetical protein
MAFEMTKTQHLLKNSKSGVYYARIKHGGKRAKPWEPRSSPTIVSGVSLLPLQCLRLTACLAVYLIVAGCATHKTAAPPPVTYPPTSESALREFRGLPQGPFDRLAIITVAGEVGEQLASAIKGARETAAQKGANALVVLKEAEFLQKVGQRTVKVRRITYLAIHIR